MNIEVIASIALSALAQLAALAFAAGRVTARLEAIEARLKSGDGAINELRSRQEAMEGEIIRIKTEHRINHSRTPREEIA